MASFSTSSKEKLATCDNALKELFNLIVLSFDCTVLEGHRSLERQLALYNAGRSKVKEGKHNTSPSLAVDVAPYPVNWHDLERFYFFGGFVLGAARIMEIPIRWGGDWDGDKEVMDQTFNDLVHFEVG